MSGNAPARAMSGNDVAMMARYAEELLNNPLLTVTLEKLKSECVAEWTDEESPERREACWYDLQAVLWFEKELRRRIDHAKLAQAREKRPLSDSALRTLSADI